MNRALVGPGLVLMVVPIIIVLFMLGAGSWEAFFGALWFLGTFFPILFAVGLILLIVGLVTGPKEPNVIVVQGGQAPPMGQPAPAQPSAPKGPRVRCPDCPGLSPADARFCMECGRALA